MSDKAAYPTGAQLTAYLAAAGISTTADVDTAVLTGRRAFERAANRIMLADAEVSERTFTPPGNSDVLIVDDMAVAPTLVEYEPYGVTAVELAEGESYVLEPRNALAKGEPYTMIRFRRRRWSLPLTLAHEGALKVTARWGYGTTIPADAWQAMMLASAASIYEQVYLATTGGRLSMKQGDSSVDFGIQTWQGLLSGWKEKFEATAAYYRRWDL